MSPKLKPAEPKQEDLEEEEEEEAEVDKPKKKKPSKKPPKVTATTVTPSETPATVPVDHTSLFSRLGLSKLTNKQLVTYVSLIAAALLMLVLLIVGCVAIVRRKRRKQTFDGGIAADLQLPTYQELQQGSPSASQADLKLQSDKKQS